jgi:hypothetical protein
VRLEREFDANGIAWSDLSRSNDDGHHARFSHQLTVCVVVEDGGHQAILQAVELGAGVTEASNLDHRILAEVKFRPSGKGQEVDAAGGDVLAHLASADRKAAVPQFIVQLSMDEVDLAQVGLLGVAGDAGAVLHGGPGVGIALDAETGEEADALIGGFGEGVGRAAVHSHDDRVHDASVESGRHCG